MKRYSVNVMTPQSAVMDSRGVALIIRQEIKNVLDGGSYIDDEGYIIDSPAFLRRKRKATDEEKSLYDALARVENHFSKI
jgi:hypothetical protein